MKTEIPRTRKRSYPINPSHVEPPWIELTRTPIMEVPRRSVDKLEMTTLMHRQIISTFRFYGDIADLRRVQPWVDPRVLLDRIRRT